MLEAKYEGGGNSSGSKKGKLKKTKTGRQGSKSCAEGQRLGQAVGDGKAEEIRDHNNFKGPESWLFVCMAAGVVMFIDVRKKWPGLYTGKPTTARKPKRIGASR